MAEIHIDWNDQLILNNSEIDAQHQKLIQFANRVFDTQDLKEVIQRAFDLYTYTREHFHLEEALMQKRHYKGLEVHRELHNDLIYRLNQCLEEIKVNPQEAHTLLHALMVDWVVVHILTQDMMIPKQ